jgi:hypothetical protein
MAPWAGWAEGPTPAIRFKLALNWGCPEGVRDLGRDIHNRDIHNTNGNAVGLQIAMSDRLRVYFTIDTETSIGGAWQNAGPPLPLGPTVFGESGGQRYGVTLIMDILEQYGFTGTFFVEVFCSYHLGMDALAEAIECIQNRGHDVQLHLHPVHRFYWEYMQGSPRREQDLMFQFTAEEQRQLIQDGVRLFRRLSGRPPRAFRAGCYGASEVTLAALRESGVLIDSSYNLSFLDKTCGFQSRPLNAPQFMEGVHEFPVTNFSSGRTGWYKPLEISAVSVWEILAAIRSLEMSDCRDVVLIFHSFSFLKRRGVRFEKACPDRIVIQRFRKLCLELWKMRDEVEVSVLGNANLSNPLPKQPHTIPSVSWFRAAARKTVQGLDYIPWV